MRRRMLLLLAAAASLAALRPADAGTAHYWQVTSPDHEQTFASGTETSRVWRLWRGHLALLLDFTNDPFVDRTNPRQYDNFRFDFPTIRLGADGRTFYLHTDHGRRIPVASIHHDFLGFDEVRLLPNVAEDVSRPHGYITVSLQVLDPGGLATPH